MQLVMALSDSEWKDWAWIKEQSRKRPALWPSVAVWLVSGSLPIVPIYGTKGEGEVFFLGRFPPLLFYLHPLGWPCVAVHIALSGILGMHLVRVIRWVTRRTKPGWCRVDIG
jgi:hypothetical protein